MSAEEAVNCKETLACLIIDDPLLKPKYGCLDYEVLLEEMKIHNFFTEIAFIPYNWKRSDPKTIRLFMENKDRYAICVHGCNHLGNEFGKGSYEELSALASLALWRMEEHARVTGLPYEPVLVFPQGLFCSVAMKALKDQGFFAVFNTTIRATDAKEPPQSEYQRAATMIYHDLPLFLRRYPRDKAKFVEDLANGRPILIVEHHSLFRNGYKPLTDLIDWINSQGNIRWTSLLKIAEHYSGKKWIPSHSTLSYQQLDLSTRLRAFLRRFLCEFRDDYLEPNELLAKVYRKVRG